jgi:hypothetical protein
VIDLRIEAETPAQLIAQIMALAAGFATGGPVNIAAETKVEEEKPAAPKSRKATPTKAEEPKPSPDKEPEEKAASKSEEPSSAAADGMPEGVDPTDKDSVRAYLSASIDVLGGPAVTEVFGQYGATSFKGIDPKNYGPMVIRLAELREAAEQEG